MGVKAQQTKRQPARAGAKLTRSKSVVLRAARTPLTGAPPIFHTDADAVRYAYQQGVFLDMGDAERQISALRQLHSGGAWAVWLGIIAQRVDCDRRGSQAATT